MGESRIGRWILALAWVAGTSLTPLTALAAPTKVAAKPAPANNGQALEISPPVIDITANPGQVVHQQILIRNISSGSLVVRGQINDFIAGGEDGKPKLLLDPSEVSPYSVKGWVGGLPAMTLVSREIRAMSVSIAIPQNASPGGHYGVIRFTATPPALDGTGVSLAASLGSLILVRVNGAITENLKVKEFSVNVKGKTSHFFEGGTLDFVERLQNGGNVHLVPSGQVHVKNFFGKPIADLGINQPPHNVLPASIRKFDQPMDKSVIGNKHLFGRYTATMNLTYGDSKKTLVASFSFWVIPWKLILGLMLLVIIGFFVLRAMIRRYNDRIISQSLGGRSGRRPSKKRRNRL